MNDDLNNNDVRARIIEGSGYEEFQLDKSLSPYVDIYSDYKNVNNSIQNIGMILQLIMNLGNMVVDNHPDENVVKELINYLEQNNYIVEQITTNVDDAIEKLKVISDSEYNIQDLIDNNKNNVSQDDLESVKSLFKFLNEELSETVSLASNFKDDLLLNFKVAIEECLIQKNIDNAILEECDTLLQSYNEAVSDQDEIQANRIAIQIQEKLQNIISNENFSVNVDDSNINIGVKTAPLDTLDLSQDLSNPNLLEVKDNTLMTDDEFMEMKNLKGREYAEEYIYTLPASERSKFFILLDL